MEQDKLFSGQIDGQIVKEADHAKRQAKPSLERLHLYTEFYKNHGILLSQSSTCLQDIQVNLAKNNIQFHPKTLSIQHLSLRLVKESINGEVMIFEAAWGKFSMLLSVLNVVESNRTHSKLFAKGTYGNIYQILSNGMEFAVKCIPFNNFKQLGWAQSMAFKEYFLLKIASVLQIGPKIKNQLGFDLIMYEQCIEFSLEICKQMIELPSNRKMELLKSTYLMHQMGLVHFDIKPQNIMFSPSFDKVVFIDFGLSSLLKQKIGMTTAMFFRGTLNFCSPQMMQIFQSSKKQQIDAYYNDLFCLENSFQNFEKESSLLYEVNFYQPSISFNSFTLIQIQPQYFRLFKIKKSLFEQQLSQLITIFQKEQEIIERLFVDQIITFLLEINPSEQIKKIYSDYIKSYKKQGIQHLQVSYIYSSGCHLFRKARRDPQKRRIFWANYINIPEVIIKEDISSYSKEKVFNILMKNNKKQMDRQMYFALYLQYISFSNNTFDVNMEDRLRATSCVLSSGYLNLQGFPLQILDQKQEVLMLINMTIKRIFQEMLVAENCEDQNLSENAKKLMYDLVEHMFIFQTDNQSQLILQVEKLYTILDPQSQLQLILKIKHNTRWMQYCLKNDEYENNQLVYQKLISWCENKLKDLKDEAIQMQPLIDYLSGRWISHFSPQIELEVDLSKLPVALQQQIRLQIFSQELKNESINDIDKKITQIYDSLHSKDLSRIHFFLFDICEIYLFRLNDKKRSNQVFKHIEKNVNCSIITDRLIFKQLIKFYIGMEKDVCLDSMECFITHLNLHQIFMYHEILKKSVTQLRTLAYQPDSNYEKIKLITGKLQRIVSLIDFKIVFNRYVQGDSRHHHCLNFYQISNLMTFKFYYYELVKEKYDFMQQLQVVRQFSLNLKCKLCYYIVDNLCEFETQNYFLISLRKNPDQIIASRIQECFIESYDRLAILHEQDYLNVQYYRRQSAYSLYSLCIIDPKYQQRYRGIEKLYFYLKKANQLIDYLTQIQYSLTMLLKTFSVLLVQVSIEELVYFMKTLTDLMQSQYSSSYFCLLLQSFGQFVSSNAESINFSLLMNLLQQKDANQSIKRRNIYHSIYHYISVYYLEGKSRYRSKLKIITALPYLPVFMKHYLESHYFRFLIKQIIEQKMNSKKERKIRKWIIKIVKILNIINTPQQKIKKKKHIANEKKKMLYKKALKMGGPYNLHLPQLTYTYIKPL